ncbi:hypothetical protein CU098_003029 [Rhizopus stolonifer]|uniref:Muniscin C-terminal domain-containing protein n=1 Tax=Rhizopus stolonifer TaxID=4846 RepID=A0A367J7K2_RHIST|nr:hypothetical protein CU098_003029 [Rhizopus stolonifer]
MWERLYQETTLVSNIHSEYSKKIVEEIEQPLRHCMMNNSDYHKVQSMEESLIKMFEINSIRRDQQEQHRQNTIPHLRKAASFAAATLTRQQPTQSKESIPVTDPEGYSIPPERNHTWPSETSEFLVEAEEMSSDSGSVFSNSVIPRLRINIKNETVKDESNETDALARVATLLKEKSPTTRKSRGRREGRSTQLYSVTEQPKTLVQSSEEMINQPPTMDVSITETLDVLSRSGQIEHATLTGQVYAQYTGPTQSPLPVCFQLITPPDTTLQLTDHIHRVSDDIYQLNHADLTQSQSIILTYQTPLHHLPLEIKSMWKCEADKSRLLVKYQKNMDHLENVMLATSVLDVQDTQSIPSGEINLAQHRIKWDLLEIQGLIKAQFQTKQEREAQPIAVRFESQELFSGLQVKQGDDVNVFWVNIREMKTRAKTGKFIVF